MTRYEITLPLRDNDGSDLADVHDHLRGVLLTQFGGFSEYAVRGQWRDPLRPERVHADDSVRYVIDAQDGYNDHNGMRVLARELRDRARQESLYVTAQEIRDLSV